MRIRVRIRITIRVRVRRIRVRVCGIFSSYSAYGMETTLTVEEQDNVAIYFKRTPHFHTANLVIGITFCIKRILIWKKNILSTNLLLPFE